MNPKGCLLFVLLLLTACSSPSVYHSFQSLPCEGWASSDTLGFEVKVTDSLTAYVLTVEVRNRNDYPYRELLLSVGYDAPNTPPLPPVFVQATLNGEDSNNWTGKGCGNLYQTSIPAGSLLVGKPGTYRIKVSHRQTDEQLKGISDIGIKLTK